MSHKVSILVPVYNAEGFIEECLDSILSQDYPNIQVVVGDDCSKDSTRSILLKYAERDSRIVLILNERNLGITNNCDNLLAKCDGKYLCLFAGDDVMLPGKISAQVSFMEQNPSVPMSFHSVEIFDSNSRVVLDVTYPNGIHSFSMLDVISNVGIAGAMSVMARLDKVPSDIYKSDIRYVTDWLFQIMLCSSGDAKQMPGLYCRYRKYGENNGKNLLAYEHEFNRVLDLVSDKFAGRDGLSNAVNIARGRLLAGAAFRLLMKNNRKLARDQMAQAIRLDTRFVYLASYALTFIPVNPSFLLQLKKSLKALVDK
ncbi:glycosyltransferase [Pseudomonas sp. URMO17WK12:I2]|uniref:glycosyltransferase family 2 protein n=1 Tax=Pseudomonas sp. URMO17WK12:I2 TaxID=1261623 RepID=UPI000DAE5014|nr:glycosyltransferase [Pseudomonas sp. URMO17WK12:I2]PZW43405.1 glycosyl transferase family 2 [Pseudomonas sp. URMO17WK12:I2]